MKGSNVDTISVNVSFLHSKSVAISMQILDPRSMVSSTTLRISYVLQRFKVFVVANEQSNISRSVLLARSRHTYQSLLVACLVAYQRKLPSRRKREIVRAKVSITFLRQK